MFAQRLPRWRCWGLVCVNDRILWFFPRLRRHMEPGRRRRKCRSIRSWRIASTDEQLRDSWSRRVGWSFHGGRRRVTSNTGGTEPYWLAAMPAEASPGSGGSNPGSQGEASGGARPTAGGNPGSSRSSGSAGGGGASGASEPTDSAITTGSGRSTSGACGAGDSNLPAETYPPTSISRPSRQPGRRRDSSRQRDEASTSTIQSAL